MNLHNKVALVTGGARIGVTVAEELARRGCHVILTYRSSRAAALEAMDKALRWGVRSFIIRANMAKKHDVKKVMQFIRAQFGVLHVLVNMVSLYQRTPFGRLTEKKWNLNIDANLKSAYLTVLASAPLLRKKGGRIIHFSDWIADSGRPRYKDFLPYYTAKAGLLGLTQAQALELAPHVLVNAIAPGPILPPKNLSEKENKEVKRVTPLGKWGGSREIAKTVLFLAETDFVTGECIRVDGGRHLL